MERRCKPVIGPIGHRAASASVGAATRPFDIQALEARVLLSAAAADVALPKGFVEIQWKGEARHAKAGEWILKLDEIEGKNHGQVRKIERLLGDASVDADVVRHLNADGVVLIRTAAGKKHAALSAALR